MPTATPDNVMSVLAEFVRSAAEASAAPAAGAPDKLRQFLTEHVDEAGKELEAVKELPNDVAKELRKSLDPPDWFSLLAIVLLELQKLDPEHLRVGVAHPQGWSRMLTLGYAREVAEAALIVIGLGITDKADDNGPVKRGIKVHANSTFPRVAFPSDETGTLTFALTAPANEDVNWEWAFGSGAKAPDGELGLKAELVLTVPKLMPDKAVAGIDVGAVKLIAEFGSGAPKYKFSLSVAPARELKNGIEAHLDPAALLGKVPILSIVGIHEGVSAQVTLAQGSSPQFTFTQEHL
jgi:hypothetical protein